MCEAVASLEEVALAAGRAGAEALPGRLRAKRASDAIAQGLWDYSNARMLYLYKHEQNVRRDLQSVQDCNDVIREHETDDGRTVYVSQKWCKKRLCINCNRLRTAQLIDQYLPVIQKFDDPAFLTLTIPNVDREALPAALDNMHRAFKSIQDKSTRTTRGGKGHKGGRGLVGLRKLECTYNRARGDYHPHYHVVADGVCRAQDFMNDWLKAFPTATAAAQDVRAADEHSAKELFKYFSKLVTKTSAGKTEVHPESLYWIYASMKARRIFQPFGCRAMQAPARPAVELGQQRNVWVWIRNSAPNWYHFTPDHDYETMFDPGINFRRALVQGVDKTTKIRIAA